ncbi:MAG TPA: adenylate/guanylate cyclase domain-containing protein [Stellaceae bacterium]|nr:adenylate/guanylate cyclase domain-containing protein [Stellaceae bacterium]
MSESVNSVRSAAQRRYLTMLFCDLVGYTELAEQLDPEDLRELLQDQYRRCALALVEKYGGVVASFSGDGVLAYFGYPVAHENDAERAVRAALELVEAVAALEVSAGGRALPRLAVRIGVHTGVVVVGPEPASMGQLEHGVVGEAANLAARLQSAAQAGTVLVSQATLELVEGLFEAEALGAKKLKGFSRPVAVHRIVAARHAIGRSWARWQRGAARMIGREGELERLLAAWQAMQRRSRCTTVQVIGEAGVGKTRLVLELCRRPELANATILQMNCLEIFASTPLYPLVSFLWARGGLAATDGEETRKQKIAVLVEQLGADAPDSFEIIANLLLAPAGASKGLGPTPVLARRRQNALFVSLVERLARAEPTVLWIEDVHWLDPSSAELLHEMVEHLASCPILVVLTLRSFPKGPMLPTPDEAINLEQLAVEECLALARSVPGARSVSKELLTRAAEASDGIPLYIEQLMLSLINKEARGSGEGGDALPLTLAEIMSERLDRLEGGRRVVQAAACTGRSFAPEFVAALLGQTREQVIAPLEALVAAEILRRRRDGPSEAYEFRHALLQRVAYESMVQPERRAMHARIVEVLKSGVALGPVPPEVMAHHLTAAGRLDDAIRAWLHAGASASRRSAQVEAIAHLKRGLGLVDDIRDPKLRRQFELELEAALIGPLTATQGTTSEDFSACCERGLQLAGAGEPTPLISPFVFGKFAFAIGRGRIRMAVSFAEHFLALAERSGNLSGQVIGHRLVAMAVLGECQTALAREHLERSLALYLPERDEAATHMYGQNTQVHSRALLSLTHFLTGEIDRSLEVGREALRAADALRHPHSTALALGYVGGWVLGLCGASDELMRSARRLIAIADQHRLGPFRTMGTAFLGWALCQQGYLDQGIAVLQQAIDAFEAAGFRLTVSGHLAFLADAKRRRGDLRGAEELSARAMEMVAEGSDVRWLEPEVCRIAALIEHDIRPQEQAAHALLGKAIDRAQTFGFPVFERRCLATLAELQGPERHDGTVAARLRQLAHLGDLDRRASEAMREVDTLLGVPDDLDPVPESVLGRKGSGA